MLLQMFVISMYKKLYSTNNGGSDGEGKEGGDALSVYFKHSLHNVARPFIAGNPGSEEVVLKVLQHDAAAIVAALGAADLTADLERDVVDLVRALSTPARSPPPAPSSGSGASGTAAA